jgi:chromosome segregation ATPase
MSQNETAEERFRAAFERLKEYRPNVLPSGTPVSQNNVAKEAGTDPTALRKARYPALIREIQAWVELNGYEAKEQKKRQDRNKKAREDVATKLKSVETQRDFAQSQLLSAHRQVVELTEQNAHLQARIDELLPPPRMLRR